MVLGLIQNLIPRSGNFGYREKSAKNRHAKVEGWTGTSISHGHGTSMP